MKKYIKNIKKRTTAFAMAAITAVSLVGTGMTSAFAASRDVYDTASEVEVSAAKSTIDKIIEVSCDTTPGMKILGAAGIGVVDGLFGSVFGSTTTLDDVNDHITRSTDEIVKDIKSLQQVMTVYHNEEMAALKDLSEKLDSQDLKISLLNYNAEQNNARAAHEAFMNSIAVNAAFISNDFDNNTYKIVDPDTYNAFRTIINDSTIQTEFGKMKVYLDKQGGTYELLSKLEKDDYDKSIDNQIIGTSGGICSADALSQLASYDRVTNDLKGHESAMFVYYIDCLQLAQMKYDVRNYEIYHNYPHDPSKLQSELQKSETTLQNEVAVYTDMLQEVESAFNASAQKLDAQKAADVSITAGGKTYSFSVDDATKGWLVADTMAAFDSKEVVSDITFTLNKDWTTSGSGYGFYPNEAYWRLAQQLPSETLNGDGQHTYLMLPGNGTSRGFNTLCVTLNLNGHSIKAPESFDSVLFKYDPKMNNPCYLTINGDDNRQSTIDNATFGLSSINSYLNLTINNVTLNQRGDKNMFFCVGDGDVLLNHCTVNYEAQAIHSADSGQESTFSWKFNYDFADSTLNHC